MRNTTLSSMSNIPTLTNPFDLIKWITNDDRSECMLLDPEAPFLAYRTDGKPQIKSVPIDGHETKSAYVPYGIQGYAYSVLGNNEFVPKRQFKTTCGNPYCMNPEHIVPCEATPKPTDYYEAADIPPSHWQVHRQMHRMFGLRMTDEQISKRLDMRPAVVAIHRYNLLNDLMGEGFDWKDLEYALDVAEGIKYANKSSSQRLVDMFSSTPSNQRIREIRDQLKAKSRELWNPEPSSLRQMLATKSPKEYHPEDDLFDDFDK